MRPAGGVRPREHAATHRGCRPFGRAEPPHLTSLPSGSLTAPTHGRLKVVIAVGDGCLFAATLLVSERSRALALRGR